MGGTQSKRIITGHLGTCGTIVNPLLIIPPHSQAEREAEKKAKAEKAAAEAVQA